MALVSNSDRSEQEQLDLMLQRLTRREDVQKKIREWSNEKDEKIVKYYDDRGIQKPRDYKSTHEVLVAIKRAKSAMLLAKSESGDRSNLTIEEQLQILISTCAFTVNPAGGAKSALLTYDYDNKIYTYSNHILAEYIAALTGHVSRSVLQTFQMSLVALSRELAPYNPAPEYKVAVGNGVFNCLTGRLEEPDPMVTVTEKINTPYDPDAYDTSVRHRKGRTFSKMCTDLANYNPSRVQLLHQICKAVVTGHSVAPALFIVVGRGGDGKSTFFQMMVNVIGESNSAFVNFSELDAADKMVETVNKKMVLGMDNDVNLYIKKTALLKSISSHEYITHSRKYDDAISVKFTGSFIQLCNEMPRFAETGESMLRRLVCLHAENSHYVLGTEDRSMSQLIEDPEFHKHVLAQILNEDVVGFYRDFNDVDKRLVESALDNEDILGQFVEEMMAIGALSASNTMIPASHLYAVYQDWMKLTNPNSSPLSNRGFTMKVTKAMDSAGYSLSNTMKGVRSSSLEKTGMYSPDLFSTYANGASLEKTIEINAVTRIFERTHSPSQRIVKRRGAVQCSSLQYFGVLDEFLSWAKNRAPEVYEMFQDPEKYVDLGNEKSASAEIIEHIENEVDKSTLDDVRARQALDAARAIERKRIEAMLQPPVDIRELHTQSDQSKLSEYRNWFENLGEIETNDSEYVLMINSAIDNAAAQFMRVARLEQDHELSNIAKRVAESKGADALEAATDFFDELEGLYKIRAAIQKNT